MRRLLLCLAVLFYAFPAAAFERWVVYYGEAEKPEALAPYDVILLDSDAHPALPPLHASGKTLLGYISAGEAESFRHYFNDIRSKKLLLSPNGQWKGHTIIDVRNPAWTFYMTDTLIPAILAQGFDGIMLDTLDSPLQLEASDPRHYAGMHTAAVQMVKTIRARYPHIKIMLNRAFDILPAIASSIDMELAEDIRTDWQPGTPKPVLQAAKDYAQYVNTLTNAQKISPALKVYTLDYWPAQDTPGIKKVYSDERAHNFIPYVASALTLQTITPEPQ